jgi:hypothetical protein
MNAAAYLIPNVQFDSARAELITSCYQTADISADYDTIKRSLYIDDVGRFFAVDIGHSADGRRFAQTSQLSAQHAHAWCEANNVDLDTVSRFFSRPSSDQPSLDVFSLLTRKWHCDSA